MCLLCLLPLLFVFTAPLVNSAYVARDITYYEPNDFLAYNSLYPGYMIVDYNFSNGFVYRDTSGNLLSNGQQIAIGSRVNVTQYWNYSSRNAGYGEYFIKGLFLGSSTPQTNYSSGFVNGPFYNDPHANFLKNWLLDNQGNGGKSEERTVGFFCARYVGGFYLTYEPTSDPEHSDCDLWIGELSCISQRVVVSRGASCNSAFCTINSLNDVNITKTENLFCRFNLNVGQNYVKYQRDVQAYGIHSGNSYYDNNYSFPDFLNIYLRDQRPSYSFCPNFTQSDSIILNPSNGFSPLNSSPGVENFVNPTIAPGPLYNKSNVEPFTRYCTPLAPGLNDSFIELSPPASSIPPGNSSNVNSTPPNASNSSVNPASPINFVSTICPFGVLGGRANVSVSQVTQGVRSCSPAVSLEVRKASIPLGSSAILLTRLPDVAGSCDDGVYQFAVPVFFSLEDDSRYSANFTVTAHSSAGEDSCVIPISAPPTKASDSNILVVLFVALSAAAFLSKRRQI